MKTLFVTSECYPFIKVGGLGDVAGSLPKALKKAGLDISIILPYYGDIKLSEKNRKLIFQFEFTFKNEKEKVSIYQSFFPGTKIKVFFLKNNNYISKEGPYIRPFETEVNQFIFFCRATLKFLKEYDQQFDLIHMNDWHTAIIPGLLKTEYRVHHILNKIATILTIHNLGPQGITGTNVLDALAISEYSLPSIAWDAEDKNIDILLQGIMNSEIINTVSPSYAKEILTPEFGEGLDGVLKSKEDRLFGVINGIDYSVFNPETDNSIHFRYGVNNFESGKKQNKIYLQKKMELQLKEDSPLIGVVTRLTDQKGIDLIIKSTEALLKKDFQIVILGTGQKKYEEELVILNKKHKGNFKTILKYDGQLARQIFAGCDMFLIPSRFEPCGLTQMISMKYGTVPIVRAVGGLKDTVENLKSGFVFSDYKASEMKKSILEAKELFKDKGKWEKMVSYIMKKDFSWDSSAQEYLKLYEKAITLKKKEENN